MFSKVLIATDSSPSSYATLGCADALYMLGTRECVLAQCFMIKEQVAFPDQIKDSIVSSLDTQKEILESKGIKTTVVAELGLAGEQIPKIAEKRNCSLIVAGSHGHNLANEILLGGTAAEIIHQTKKPVLIIHLKADEETGKPLYADNNKNLRHHILYATDFSEHSSLAFEYVCKFVECGTVHVTLLHVQDQARLGIHLKDRLDEFNEIDKQRLEELKKRLVKIGDAEIDIEIPYGSPVSEILKRINGTDVSAVIMGSHGRGFISEIFLGSVSHNVIRHSQSPVLLIPRQIEGADPTKESCNIK
ncbi:Universal stress protein [Limihaloglobus sulfuriphilus]|uniref:Universal stress protein n=1 Tax=Limihaloglobus sulfuriphilus TaxID=1851148 RepID=A0A1Q2MGF3_9BACT|nr:universal stress protein [Limihaloglobus sulfuriphilus]AQQ71785.1 Universal stress protein [Limihaloglobus sulfuriphilus]